MLSVCHSVFCFVFFALSQDTHPSFQHVSQVFTELNSPEWYMVEIRMDSEKDRCLELHDFRELRVSLIRYMQ